MARKRMIDPTIWEDPAFATLSRDARLLFIGLLSNADDEGYLRGHAGSLRRLVFGFDDDMEAGATQALLNEVAEKIHSVHVFEKDGQIYIHLANWHKYQKQQKDRIIASNFPKCNKCETPAIQLPPKVSKDKLRKDKISKNIIAEKPQLPTQIKKYERKPPEKQTQLQRIGYFLEDTLKTTIVNWGKQAKALEMMLKAGYTESQIIFAIKYMAKDEFYEDKGFDLMTVANNIANIKSKMRKGT